MAKLNSSYKRWSLDCHDVSVEILEDLGVSAIDDDSCSNNSSVKQLVITKKPEQAVKRKAEFSPPTPALVDSAGEEESSESFLLSKRRRLEAPPGQYGFSKLSDEIILCVFKWLPKSTVARCAQVSKRWKRLAYDEVLWRRLDLSGSCLKPTILGTVLLRGTQVLRLAKSEICDPIYPAEAPPPHMCPSFHNLQYLDLSMSSISTQGLCEIFNTCQSLKKLSLEHCSVDEQVCELLGKNEKLEVLNMSMCYGVSEAGLKWIAEGCRKIDSWNLSWTKLSSSTLQMLCSSASNSLQRINLSGCRETLKDEHVLSLCKRCPNLVELDISDAGIITSETVTYIHEYLTKLEYLAMARCYHVQIPAFLKFQKSELLYLDVFGMLNDSMLQTLRAKLPNIEINKFYFSSVARPTVGIRRTSIWSLKVRE